MHSTECALVLLCSASRWMCSMHSTECALVSVYYVQPHGGCMHSTECALVLLCSASRWMHALY